MAKINQCIQGVRLGQLSDDRNSFATVANLSAYLPCRHETATVAVSKAPNNSEKSKTVLTLKRIGSKSDKLSLLSLRINKTANVAVLK